MRALTFVAAVVVVAGCAAQTRDDDTVAVAKRVDEICALPADEREAALRKLKEETGYIAYCGAD